VALEAGLDPTEGPLAEWDEVTSLRAAAAPKRGRFTTCGHVRGYGLGVDGRRVDGRKGRREEGRREEGRREEGRREEGSTVSLVLNQSRRPRTATVNLP
jgi:hypothetical protein